MQKVLHQCPEKQKNPQRQKLKNRSNKDRMTHWGNNELTKKQRNTELNQTQVDRQMKAMNQKQQEMNKDRK